MKHTMTNSSPQPVSIHVLTVYILSAVGTCLGIFLGAFGDVLLGIDTRLIGAVLGASIGGSLQQHYPIPLLLRSIITIFGITSGLLIMIGMPPRHIHPMVFLSLLSATGIGLTAGSTLIQYVRHISVKNGPQKVK